MVIISPERGCIDRVVTDKLQNVPEIKFKFKKITLQTLERQILDTRNLTILTLSVPGVGGTMYHALSIYLITQKVLEVSFSFFLTFNRIELSVFCQKIKVIGLT